MGKKVSFISIYSPSPSFALPPQVPLSVRSEADLDSLRSAKLTVVQMRGAMLLKESSKITPVPMCGKIDFHETDPGAKRLGTTDVERVWRRELADEVSRAVVRSLDSCVHLMWFMF